MVEPGRTYGDDLASTAYRPANAGATSVNSFRSPVQSLPPPRRPTASSPDVGVPGPNVPVAGTAGIGSFGVRPMPAAEPLAGGSVQYYSPEFVQQPPIPNGHPSAVNSMPVMFVPQYGQFLPQAYHASGQPYQAYHPGYSLQQVYYVPQPTTATPTPVSIPVPHPTPPGGLSAPSPSELIAPAEVVATNTETAPLQRPVPEPLPERAPRWNSSDWLVVLALLLATFALVGLHVRRYPQLSPIDELQHIDYAEKASRFQIPRRGELVGDAAMEEAACRGVDAPNYVGPPCGLDDYDPATFQEAGVNTAASQYPVYYVITGLIARGVVATGLVDSFVVAARMVGALWLGFGMVLLWYVFAIISVGRLQRAAILSVFIATPLLVFHASTVSSDAALFFCGALVVLGTVKFASGEWGWWWLVPLLLFVYFTEPTNSVMIAASMLFLVIDAIRNPHRKVGAWLFPAIALVAVGLLRWRYGAWLHRQIWPAVPTTNRAPMFADRAPVDLTAETLVNQIPATFMPISNVYLPPFMRDGFTTITIELANWLTIALTAITAFVGRRQARLTVYARIIGAACLIAGPLYTFYYAEFSDVLYPAPGRFGLPLLAGVILVAGAALLTRFATAITALVGVAVITNAVWHLVA